jgi:hypothetical protein
MGAAFGEGLNTGHDGIVQRQELVGLWESIHLSESVLFCETFGLLRRNVVIFDDPSHELVPWT